MSLDTIKYYVILWEQHYNVLYCAPSARDKTLSQTKKWHQKQKIYTLDVSGKTQKQGHIELVTDGQGDESQLPYHEQLQYPYATSSLWAAGASNFKSVHCKLFKEMHRVRRIGVI